MSGYAFIYRTLLDHPVFRTDAEGMAFAWMVLRASWKPRTNRYKGFIIELERGQFVMSLRDIGERLEWSKDRVRRFLNTLQKHHMIATDTRQGLMVVTISNYDKYQAIGETCETPSATGPRQDRDRTATQSKEGKEGNKESPKESPARAKRTAPITADWRPEPFGPKSKSAQIIAGWSADELETQIEHFIAHHGSRANCFVWQDAWKTWVLNSTKFGGRRNGTGDFGRPDKDVGSVVSSMLADLEREGQGRAEEAAADDRRSLGAGDGRSGQLALPRPS